MKLRLIYTLHTVTIVTNSFAVLEHVANILSQTSLHNMTAVSRDNGIDVPSNEGGGGGRGRGRGRRGRGGRGRGGDRPPRTEEQNGEAVNGEKAEADGSSGQQVWPFMSVCD